MGIVTKDKNKDVEDDETQDESGPQTFQGANGEQFTVREDDGSNSDSEGQVPPLREGARVEIVCGPATKGADGKLEDGSVHRMGVILETYFENQDEALKAATPANPERRFAKVAAYDVRTRDSRDEIIHVTPDQIRESDYTQGWGRGRAA